MTVGGGGMFCRKEKDLYMGNSVMIVGWGQGYKESKW